MPLYIEQGLRLSVSTPLRLIYRFSRPQLPPYPTPHSPPRPTLPQVIAEVLQSALYAVFADAQFLSDVLRWDVRVFLYHPDNRLRLSASRLRIRHHTEVTCLVDIGHWKGNLGATLLTMLYFVAGSSSNRSQPANLL